MKEGTLNARAHKILTDYGITSIGQSIGVHDVKKLMVTMSEQQQERSYSEEEVLKLLRDLNNLMGDVESVKDWFEQFKK